MRASEIKVSMYSILPDQLMGATNKFWFRIPVIVRDETFSFDEYPLTSFS